MEHHNLWNKHENDNFQFSINFYLNLPKISFIHKMCKNKVFTWNEHLLSTQKEIWNRPFCKFNQINQKLTSISK